MKKMKYIQPQTCLIQLKTMGMLATSNTFSGDSVTLTPNSMTGGSGSDAASRRDLWDWDDEDYE